MCDRSGSAITTAIWEGGGEGGAVGLCPEVVLSFAFVSCQNGAEAVVVVTWVVVVGV